MNDLIKHILPPWSKAALKFTDLLMRRVSIKSGNVFLNLNSEWIVAVCSASPMPLCLWVPIEKPSLTASNALSNLPGFIALCRRLVARGALALRHHLRLSGNRLHRRDNDSRDRLFNPLCAAILCARGLAVTCALRECHSGTWRPSRKLGTGAKCVSSTTQLTSRPSVWFQI